MTNALLSLSTNDFIAGIEAIAPRFDTATYPQQNLPADDWTLLTRAGVLLPTLPREFGGRDSHVEMCRVVEALSEWNLPLGMYATVITGVALRPIALWADEEAKREVLPQYAGGDPMVCGFASTEPGCGSAMSGMTTTFEEVPGGYRIRGRKHWQAFSSSAHWWLVSAKNDDRGREYGYFIVKRSEGFRTLQPYEPLGLKVIDYGLNEIDVVVPRHRRIRAEGRNLRPMVEMLMASRAMMAAMGAGFLRRISREARAYANARRIGPGPQSAIRFVRYRLAAIDTSYTVCAALNDYLQTSLDMKSDMIGAFPAVQAIKTVATDGLPLSKFLADWPLTASAITSQGLDLGFLDRDLRQEHLVLAGRAIAYAFAIAQVMRWAAKPGNDAGRARAAIEFLKADIAGVATEFGLLSTGVLGIEDGAVPPSPGVLFSRSVPLPAEA